MIITQIENNMLPAAIGIVLSSDQQWVLLTKRRDVPIWVLPGGGIEPNEKPEEAVIREIQEETGYRVKILRKCAEYKAINRLASDTTLYLCQIGEGQGQLSEETTEQQFFPLTQLPPYFFPLHANWLNEVLQQPAFIQRPLNEINYWTLWLFFIRHPWLVLRFAWTRLFKL